MSSARPVSDVNYEPSAAGAIAETPAYVYSRSRLSGTTQQACIEKTDDLSQAGAFYRRLDAAARTRLVQNLAFARLFGRSEVADLLDAAGASRTRRDASGRSPEDWARTQAPPLAGPP